MRNPFEMIGRRNAGANFSTNAFARNNPFSSIRSRTAGGSPTQPAYSAPQQPAAAQQSQYPTTQQTAYPTTQQTAYPTNQRAHQGQQQSAMPSPAQPASQPPSGYGRGSYTLPQPSYGGSQSMDHGRSRSGWTSSTFAYNPTQGGQSFYQGSYWPTSGEMLLLQQGINPWGGQTSAEQQQWLQQVGPYMNVPALSRSFSGNTNIGPDYTAVQMAAAAGGDVSDAFVRAWLGGHDPDRARRLYDARHQWDASGASAAQQEQWGDQYGWT